MSHPIGVTRRRSVFLIEIRRGNRIAWRECTVRRSQAGAQSIAEKQLAVLGPGFEGSVFRCIVDGEVWRSS